MINAAPKIMDQSTADEITITPNFELAACLIGISPTHFIAHLIRFIRLIQPYQSAKGKYVGMKNDLSGPVMLSSRRVA
ncbi:hypothetical protein EDF56_101129 [Novosphingobium sp. PhB165]|nr:hypothetical protein EDF56_101129 [Novosphingobium sp. PhB165]